MNDIISILQNTLNINPELSFIEHYPIKIVHEKGRVKEETVLDYLESLNFFDQNGFSAHSYSNEKISDLRENTQNYIQSVSYGISKKQTYESYKFSEKFPHDRWKKIIDDNDLEAVVEISHFSHKSNLQNIETELRDIMRSRKEVPLLKKVGFIWVAYCQKDQDIDNIMQHYFLEKHKSISSEGQIIFIGWSEQLQNINMRYFVYPPNS